MRGDHDVIVDVAAAVAVVDDDAMRRALDRGRRAAEPIPIAEPGGQLLDIAAAAALDGAPDRAVILQQAMIVEEGDKILGWEVSISAAGADQIAAPIGAR